MELEPRFHQELCIYKILNKIKEGKRKFLMGWKCRAGKTYGVGHLIDQFYKSFGSINALIITPAPSETLSQFGHEMFDAFTNFRDIHIEEIKKGKQLNELRHQESNVYIISKQLLDNYVKSNKRCDFHEIEYDLIIFDENHFGGTTQKAEAIFKLFSKEYTSLVFLSATYQKTLITYNIDHDCQYYWNIEDEHFCKDRNMEYLVHKHGKDVKRFLNINNMEEKLSVYENMPELHLLSTLMEREKFKDIKKKLDNNNDDIHGFSMDVLFSIVKNDKNEFQFEFKKQVFELLNYIVKENNKNSIYKRIQYLSKKNNSRTLLTNEHFSSQLWFLPFGIGLKIDDLSSCLKKEMLEMDEFNEYEILIINSKIKTVKNLKDNIHTVECMAKKMGKKGLILLAGNQCSLGVTLPLVDVVFLLNNITSCDKIMQMMYRCMSEAKDGSKKIGYVVDFNINRVLHTFMEYPLVFDKSLNTKQKLEYMIENKLIHLDEDIFECKENKGTLIPKLLEIWKNEPQNEVQILFKKIQNMSFDIIQNDQELLNQSFSSLGQSVDEHFVKFDDEIFQKLYLINVLKRINCHYPPMKMNRWLMKFHFKMIFYHSFFH